MSRATAVSAAESAMMWEKADTVLWALTFDGIVLHNFARGLYVELDRPSHLVWSYLDGVHTPEAIADVLHGLPTCEQSTRVLCLQFVQQLVWELAEGGFIRSAA